MVRVPIIDNVGVRELGNAIWSADSMWSRCIILCTLHAGMRTAENNLNMLNQVRRSPKPAHAAPPELAHLRSFRLSGRASRAASLPTKPPSRTTTTAP